MKEKITIAVVDDQQLFRQGIISLLSEEEDFNVVFEASNGNELMDKLKERIIPPNVLLLDIEMPYMDGIEATVKVRMKYPKIKIIILTMHDEEEMVVHLVERGANGFLPKSADYDRVVDAIYSVMSNGYYFNEKVNSAMVKGLVESKKIVPDFLEVELTKKEKEIISLICKEYSNAEIADKLNLSPKTIDNNRLSIIKKLGVRNTAGIVMYAVKKGIVV